MEKNKNLKTLIRSLINESLNELSPELLNRATLKAQGKDQTARAERMTNLRFNEFINKDLFDKKYYIRDIYIRREDDQNYLRIFAMGRESLMDGSPIFYDIEKDTYETIGVLAKDFGGARTPIKHILMDRVSANLLSNIAKKINPNTKYKNVPNEFKIKGIHS